MTWIVIIVLGIVVIAAVALTIWTRFRRSKGKLQPHEIMPYGEMRERFFAEAQRGTLTKKEQRRNPKPSGKDFRLPRSVWEQAADIETLDETSLKTVMSLLGAVEESVMNEAEYLGGDAEAFAAMSLGRRGILLAWGVEAEVNNGGFDQFYLNSAGDGASQTPDALRAIGADKMAALVERANRIFPGGPPTDRNKRLSAMKTLGNGAEEVWSALESEFYDLEGLDRAKFEYLKSHQDEFFVS